MAAPLVSPCVLAVATRASSSRTFRLRASFFASTCGRSAPSVSSVSSESIAPVHGVETV